MVIINFSQWLDSNHGPLESKATVLPTEPQPLPMNKLCYAFVVSLWTIYFIFLFLKVPLAKVLFHFNALAKQQKWVLGWSSVYLHHLPSKVPVTTPVAKLFNVNHHFFKFTFVIFYHLSKTTNSESFTKVKIPHWPDKVMRWSKNSFTLGREH